MRVSGCGGTACLLGGQPGIKRAAGDPSAAAPIALRWRGTAAKTMMKFPATGRPRPEIDAALAAMAQGDADWRGGRVPLFVFGGGAEVSDVGRAAFNAYFTENALGGSRAFPSVKRMETEIIAMGLDLFHGAC